MDINAVIPERLKIVKKLMKLFTAVSRPFARHRAVLAGLVLMLPFSFVGSLQACPGCRTTGEIVKLAEPDTVQASLAMSWGVLFLLAVVGGALSCLGVLIANTIKRLDNERARL